MRTARLAGLVNCLGLGLFTNYPQATYQLFNQKNIWFATIWELFWTRFNRL